MSEIDRPDPGEEVASSWGIQVADRVVSRYANAAARDAGIPTQEGQVCYLIDVDELQVFDGSVWGSVPVAPQFKAEDGTAALPAYTFKSQLGAGLYSSGVDQIGVAVGGLVHTLFRTNPNRLEVFADIEVPDGDATNPSIGFNTDGDLGFFRNGANTLALTMQGTSKVQFSPDDLIELAAVTAGQKYMTLWENGFSTGRHYEWARAASFGVLELTAFNGAGTPFLAFRVSGDDGLVFIPANFGNTTADPANMVIASDGKMFRSTSSVAFKSSIKGIKADEAARIVAGLKPIRFKSKIKADKEDSNDPNYIGFVAEDVAELMPEAFQSENYDLRAIVAAVVKVLQGLM